jgi:hypothetical protein
VSTSDWASCRPATTDPQHQDQDDGHPAAQNLTFVRATLAATDILVLAAKRCACR